MSQFPNAASTQGQNHIPLGNQACRNSIQNPVSDFVRIMPVENLDATAANPGRQIAGGNLSLLSGRLPRAEDFRHRQSIRFLQAGR
jgi:hypothetical protein